jgi:membrane protease YdiL (CAAX protease family)
VTLQWGDGDTPPGNTAALPSGRAFGGAAPWGPGRTFIGIGGTAFLFLLSGVGTILVTVLLGAEPVVRDAKDIFEAIGKVAEYTDERLRAAALGEKLPDPPALKANIVALRTGFAATLVYQAAGIALVVAVSGRRLRHLIADFRLDRYNWSTAWQPALATAVAYGGVVAYSVVVSNLGIDALVPESTVPSAVTRDAWTLALAGVVAVIGAPISEEVFFRGLVFGGFLRWGFLPAAVISSATFSAVHFDPGSLIPFFWVGFVLAWMFWRRGTLWDAILFHTFFNGFSFILLATLGG